MVQRACARIDRDPIRSHTELLRVAEGGVKTQPYSAVNRTTRRYITSKNTRVPI